MAKSKHPKKVRSNPFLSGARILPDGVTGGENIKKLVDGAFLAYNAGRLGEACRLFADKMLDAKTTVGMTLAGALTPAGLGRSCIIPLVKAGFVDWIISTGANLYHDAHFGLGLALHRGSPFLDDRILRKNEIIRIYDVLFDYSVLLDTDAFFRELLRSPIFQKPMSTAEFHGHVGAALAAREDAFGVKDTCLLTTLYRCGVPAYTSSPGDSSIGMNVAAVALEGGKFSFDVSRDVNETASIVWNAKRTGGASAIFICGGGSPKNFALQTEPQIQEVLGLPEKGHDYFLQITDARPDTGGLSGATPSEAVSWGKIDPDKLPDSVVAYLDSTIGLPILTAYALASRKPRKWKRLAGRRDELLGKMQAEYLTRINGASGKGGKRIAARRQGSLNK
ncbi:MAG: deoxyhypusine synthase [Planctomycetes bacterium]|nr:deoxyhypusine synthase [Planctomycetota bacterium]